MTNAEMRQGYFYIVHLLYNFLEGDHFGLPGTETLLTKLKTMQATLDYLSKHTEIRPLGLQWLTLCSVLSC